MNAQTQTPQVESWSLDRLIPYARNARTHSSAQVAQIAASIAEFGFNHPVLVDAEGGIIAGHCRVLAARTLGYTQVPVIVLSHLSPNQKRAFMLADNKLALNAGWDLEILRLEMEALQEQDFGLEVAGFNKQELEELLAGLSQKTILDPDEAPEPPDKAGTKPGDLWILGEHRLLCGNGTCSGDIARVLEGKSSDLVFTHLPCAPDSASQIKIKSSSNNPDTQPNILAACRSMLDVNQGPLYLCTSSAGLHQLYRAFTEAGGHWSTTIIWAQNRSTPGRSDYQNQYEPILYSEGAKHHWSGNRKQSDVWFFDKPDRKDLQTNPKPVALAERAIKNSSTKRSLVLDPFAGAGSTVMACENTGRQARAIETDPRYVDAIVDRWQAYTGRRAVLEENGRSFEEIASERNQVVKVTVP